MKTAYTPDNTRSSIMILLSLAVIVTVVAAVIGLSDKPDVSTIVITPGTVEGAAAPANNFGFDFDDAAADLADEAAAAGDGSDAELDELGQPFDTAAAESTTADSAEAASADEPAEPERTIIEVPPSEPTPTPEIAAAVEPTPVPDEATDAAGASGEVQAAPSLPTTSGTVQGEFFTKSDENNGAVVSQNLITVSFAEDGSGAFQGVLDITYADGTHILLNMSGPLTWAPTNPQVEATLTGAYTFDAVIDADDVTADDAELSISTLANGSGSLCTSKCFGFTFPPQ